VTYGVALFHTTSSAIRAEKEMALAGLAFKMIPTPRQFSSDCGFALRFDWGQESQVRALLAEARVDVAGVHRLQ
jgi:hypothetical protein